MGGTLFQALPRTHPAYTRSLCYVMLLSSEENLRIQKNDSRWKSTHNFWPGDNKIWRLVQPKYHIRCQLSGEGDGSEQGTRKNILITSDPLHISNHTTCSDAFKSKYYPDLKPLNKEACEQFNSLLRNIQTSLTYMSFEHYMSAMKIFVAFHNLQ